MRSCTVSNTRFAGGGGMFIVTGSASLSCVVITNCSCICNAPDSSRSSRSGASLAMLFLLEIAAGGGLAVAHGVASMSNVTLVTARSRAAQNWACLVVQCTRT
eukprot:3936824-Prymnesium_polylepis.3